MLHSRCSIYRRRKRANISSPSSAKPWPTRGKRRSTGHRTTSPRTTSSDSCVTISPCKPIMGRNSDFIGRFPFLLERNWYNIAFKIVNNNNECKSNCGRAMFHQCKQPYTYSKYCAFRDSIILIQYRHLYCKFSQRQRTKLRNNLRSHLQMSFCDVVQF